MKTYEIINPSDKYTLKAEEFRDAVGACLLLGEGRYALNQIDGDERMPLFLFVDPTTWFAGTFGQSAKEFLEAIDDGRVATVLESLVIGDRDDFESATAAIDDRAKREKFVAKWNDRHRSSMNDIGARARALAERLRAKGETT